VYTQTLFLLLLKLNPFLEILQKTYIKC